jgi:hypothetical protein
MNKEIIIYSGIQPGKKGTGNFVSFFIDKFKHHKIKFQLVSYSTPSGGFLVKIAKKLGVIKPLRSLFFILARNSSSQKKITDSIVILFHPQSIGLKITANLILRNTVYIYVLDTFFFCKKSYNFIEGTNACLKCISNPDAANENNCKFLLSSQSDLEYKNLQSVISANLSSIYFLTQNENQSLLLKEKFGSTINVKKLGMLIDLNEKPLLKNKNEKIKYDFVFHNTNIEAKGIAYFIELAMQMREYRFLIPYAKSDLSKYANKLNSINNLDCISMTWETGLREAISACKIVVNPSLWSSPVEGALLKSIKSNGCVAVVPVDYSFQKEIPFDVVIHLKNEISESVRILSDAILSQQLIDNYKIKSSEWLEGYEKSTTNHFDKFIKDEFTNSIINNIL